MTTHIKSINNGIDMETLEQTVTAIQNDPHLGQSTFRIRNTWICGGQNESFVGCFHSLGAEQSHQNAFELYADEPLALGGEDESANPVEHLLNALAGCLTTSIVAHAAVHNIPVEEVTSQVEGDIDIQGFLGLDPSVPKGYQNIRVTFRIKAAPEDLPRLREFAEFSPVYNTLTQGTNIDIQIQPK
jgi:uncharacterized OsmC-like protein